MHERACVLALAQRASWHQQRCCCQMRACWHEERCCCHEQRCCCHEVERSEACWHEECWCCHEQRCCCRERGIGRDDPLYISLLFILLLHVFAGWWHRVCIRSFISVCCGAILLLRKRALQQLLQMLQLLQHLQQQRNHWAQLTGVESALEFPP